jgi:hypothetical protein
VAAAVNVQFGKIFGSGIEGPTLFRFGVIECVAEVGVHFDGYDPARVF